MENIKEEQNLNWKEETIFAAGAILSRKEPFHSEIAVIHRIRYGGEWCLPKGKPKKGETLEQTALREVKEETGCLAKIIKFASSMQYMVERQSIKNDTNLNQILKFLFYDRF